MEESLRASTADATSLEGLVAKVVYSDGDTGFGVIRLRTGEGGEEVTAVGSLASVCEGESLRLTGHYENDPRWGHRFRADGYVPLRPRTAEGIARYLASGTVKGIGPAMATRLVEHFGVETLEVIENDADRLTEVPGIGRVRSQRIEEAWQRRQGSHRAMVFLQGLGLSAGAASRILHLYGPSAVGKVRENPYRLAEDVAGIGFPTADRIATGLGISGRAPQRLLAGLLHVLRQAADSGHVYLPRARAAAAAAELLGVEVSPIEAAIDELVRAGHAVLDDESAGEGEGEGEGEASTTTDDAALYLQPLYAAESVVARRLTALSTHPARAVELDVEAAVAWYEERAGLRFDATQREALRRALTAKLLVLTGGPGTGKTTLIRGVLQVLERKGLRILLAAPTGRAARRLAESSGHPAHTLHRLLEYQPKQQRFLRDADRPLQADLIVVDETSMVDLPLFAHLLRAVPLSCRLLLVGDADQLPSVGPGRVLDDVLASRVAEGMRLTTIFRQEAGSRIVHNAHRVRAGKLPLLHEAADFYFVERDVPAEAATAICELVLERIPRRFHLDPLEDVQVLTPMHKGELGAIHLNARLQGLHNPAGATIGERERRLRVGDKVMQLRNDYERDVFNGDIGRIVGYNAGGREVHVRFDDRDVVYGPADLDRLGLAYACSIHKSQGSEYPAVVVALHTQHALLLQRNLLYTAITRGKRLVVLVGSRRALALAVRNHRPARRYTRLRSRLDRALGPPPR